MSGVSGGKSGSGAGRQLSTVGRSELPAMGVCKGRLTHGGPGQSGQAGWALGATLSVPHGPLKAPRGYRLGPSWWGQHLRRGARPALLAQPWQRWGSEVRQVGRLGPKGEERRRPPRWALSPGLAGSGGAGGGQAHLGVWQVSLKRLKSTEVARTRGSAPGSGAGPAGAGERGPERRIQSRRSDPGLWRRSRFCVLCSPWLHVQRPGGSKRHCGPRAACAERTGLHLPRFILSSQSEHMTLPSTFKVLEMESTF